MRYGTWSASIALVLSLAVILATLLVRATPSARHHVDRISWRLFVYAMGVQVLFATAYLTMYADSTVSGRACRARVSMDIPTGVERE